MRETGEKAKNDWIRESTDGKRKSGTIIVMVRGEIGRFNELLLTTENRQPRQPQSGQGDGARFGRGDNRNRHDFNLEETVRLIAAAQKAGTLEGGIQIQTDRIIHSIPATAKAAGRFRGQASSINGGISKRRNEENEFFLFYIVCQPIAKPLPSDEKTKKTSQQPETTYEKQLFIYPFDAALGPDSLAGGRGRWRRSIRQGGNHHRFHQLRCRWQLFIQHCPARFQRQLFG